MKFAALALALLLAVGCHSAALQADAPSPLAHIRAAADVYAGQAKNTLLKSLDQLDGTAYENSKADIAQYIDNAFASLKTMQTNVAPLTDNFVSTMSEATADIRSSIVTDVETLRNDLIPKFEKLRGILDNHLAEYKAILDPIVDDHSAKHRELMTELKAKMDPAIESLHNVFTENVEETKAALIPILESVREKLTDRLLSIKELITPYAEEYKEQLKALHTRAQGISGDDFQATLQKVSPLAEEVAAKLKAIFEIFSASFKN